MSDGNLSDSTPALPDEPDGVDGLTAALLAAERERVLDQQTQLQMSESEAEESELDGEEEDARLAHSRSKHDYRYAGVMSGVLPTPNVAPSPPPPQDLSAVGVWRHTLQAIRTNHSLVLNSGPGRMALLGVALGVALGIGSQWSLMGGGSLLRQLGLYVTAMSAFHLLEFTWTAIFHPNKLSAQAYLLNHSREYHLALAAGLIEFFVESLLFPSLKYPSVTASCVMWLGVLMVTAGQCVRTLAMLTAADNFTHIVADSKAPNHQLVTHGIYSVCRHPSYAGWFWWSVGTQVLLCNPLCTLAYAAASFLFFKSRIVYEERAMLGFFGDSYVQYQQRVPTGVPFIRGYIATAAGAR